MSSLEWKTVYRRVKHAARRQPPCKRRPQYSDTLIVAMHLWAVEHDRPQCWACERRHYHRPFLPRKLPSVSQFNRRIRTARCQAILQCVEDELRPPAGTRLQFLDSRPLPVGACSKDRQALAGRVYGGFARGYRLHAAMNENGYFLAWKTTGLNASEKPVACELLHRIQACGVWLADGNYDAGYLYEAAARYGGQLLATPRLGAGGGHRRPNLARQHAVTLWVRHADWLRARRKAIDRFFGQHSSYGGGLAPLPAWVRTLPRVQRWVQAKIILYHVRLQHRRDAQEVA
jgi:hypothetical protein